MKPLTITSALIMLAFGYTAEATATTTVEAHAAAPRQVSLRIVETSDVHGAFFPYDFLGRKPMKGSMARVSYYVNTQRKTYGDNLLLLDCGDILQGTPLCYYSNFVDTASVNVATEALNYMRYDAAAIGNHDVEAGPAVYHKFRQELHCPLLAANVMRAEAPQEPYFTPYVVLQRQGVKVALVGMLTPTIPYWLREELWHGMAFTDIVESARHTLATIRQKENPDVVIGMFHSGWSGGIEAGGVAENVAERVAQEVEGFDLILLGHDHSARCESVLSPEGRAVVCLDPAASASKIGVADITLMVENGRVADKKVRGEMVDISAEPVDSAYMSHFKSYLARANEFINRRVGETDSTMNSADSFFGPAAFTDLAHNIQLAITGADVSITAPLHFNMTIERGPIYVSDMFKLYKYENKLAVLKLTGEELRGHLEMSYDLWIQTMKTKDDHIMAFDAGRLAKGVASFSNPYFNFDSAAGVDYTVDVTKPFGQRVRILRMSDGRKFSPKTVYRVAMNSYRANGGGELLTRGAGIPRDDIEKRIVWYSQRDLRHYLMEYISKQGTISPRANANWRFIPTEWTDEALCRDRQLMFKEK